MALIDQPFSRESSASPYDGCQDTSDPGHFGTDAERTSAELSGHIGTSAEVSYGHFRTKKDIAGFAAPGNAGPNLGKEGAVLA